MGSPRPVPPTPPPGPPFLDRCSACGQETGAPERCPRCGSHLLVDVLLDRPPRGPRAVYGAARLAAAARVPGLDFAAARAALERPGAPLAAGLRRDHARALVDALAEGGLVAVVRATRGAAGARRGAGAPLLAAAALLLAVAAGGAVLAVRGRAVRSPAPIAAAPDPVDAASAGPVAAAPGPALAASTAAAERELTVEELGRAARPAVALLTCGGRLGSGFFVTPDRLLTNAHVVCGKDTPVQVKLGGRDLQGRVRALDPWLDWAVVEVPGAAIAAPLPLGDSTALVAGSPVVLVGSPHGLEATVHAGKVSAVPRNLQGVAHVQLNADVNPGNSGGPLLDGRGRAVGIVTLKLEGASGIGFALPVEYAREALDLPAPEPAGAGRWAGVLAAVQREDDAEAEKVLARLEKPMILAATAAGGQLGIVVMKRWPGVPSSLRVQVAVRPPGGSPGCTLAGVASEWLAVAERFREASEGERATRVVRWMVRRQIATGIFASGMLVDVSACPEGLGASATVTVEGGDEGVPYPAEDLARSRRLEEQRVTVLAAREERARGQAEAEWRQAFKALRARVAKLEEERNLLKTALDRQHDMNLVSRARSELPRVEQELARARDALDDLERRASFQSIPREWRQ